MFVLVPIHQSKIHVVDVVQPRNLINGVILITFQRCNRILILLAAVNIQVLQKDQSGLVHIAKASTYQKVYLFVLDVILVSTTGYVIFVKLINAALSLLCN